MPRRDPPRLARASPRVLLDVTAVPRDRGGVGRYLDSLVPALDAAGADLALACRPVDAAGFGALAPHARVLTSPAMTQRRPARLAWEQTGLPALVHRVGADVLHSPHYTMPVAVSLGPGLLRCPVVVTLHDATFFTDPGAHQRSKGPFFRASTRVALRLAARCLVPSGGTRDELVRVAGASAERIDVAPMGVDHATFHPPSAAEVGELRASLRLGPAGYVAFLGTLEPRKNVPNLIRGWVAACSGFADPPALVLAGGAGWDEAVEPALAAVPPGLRAIRTGYLPLDQLRALLGGALVVAYPTTGEGFGLPVLEAMACGATVLTTRRLPMPEVGGDAVAYCDVTADSIGSALRELLDDPPRRSALGAAGRTRAAAFTWEASARIHLECYRRAAGGS